MATNNISWLDTTSTDKLTFFEAPQKIIDNLEERSKVVYVGGSLVRGKQASNCLKCRGWSSRRGDIKTGETEVTCSHTRLNICNQQGITGKWGRAVEKKVGSFKNI